MAGFTNGALPLASVLATAPAGCTLYVDPGYTDLVLAIGGEVAVALPLPNTVALAGTVFHTQLVSIELNAALGVTSTDALTLKVGAW